MELPRGQALTLALGVALMAAVLGLGVPTPAAWASSELERPASDTRPPRGYALSAKQVVRIAERGAKVRAERRRHRRFEPIAYTRGPGRWQVSWFDSGDEVAQARVDDASGAVLEEWTGEQVAWTMARGYDGAFGRKLNAPYVWIPLCVLFLAPFVDRRRPFRLLHLDLLVLLGFGVSHVFFNRGEIGVSVPLVYPVLLYLLARLAWTGLRPREVGERLVPHVPIKWLALALLCLVPLRVGLNVVDSHVIDVGYAGVIGADRVADAKPLYEGAFSRDVEHGDTYGPLNYLLYLPFEQALGWSGGWSDLAAAHAAAIAFDLATLLGLVLLGRRLRAGREGRELGVALGYAWATYPYALFALQTNSNDGLVALCTVLALLALTLEPARQGLSAAARAGAVALGTAAKFAPLVLAPLLATAGCPRRLGRGRQALAFCAVLALLLAAALVPFLPDGGMRELYDRTLGYQAGRPSPFSVWGQAPSLGWLQTAVEGATALFALALAFVPRRKTPLQVAALAAGALIVLQLGATHWFYLYVVWFAPLALVALLGRYRGPAIGPQRPAAGWNESSPAEARAVRRETVPA